jgi:hypothetical protein
MTVISESATVAYTGNGSTTVFPVPYRFLASGDLKVYVAGSLVGSGYTVSGAGDPSGGNVTFSVAPINAAAIKIDRDPPITQLAAYANQDRFPASTHERALDKLTMIAQRHKLRLDGADGRLDGHDTRLDGHDDDIIDHDERLVAQASRLDTAEGRLDGHDDRLDGHDTSLAGHDTRLDVVEDFIPPTIQTVVNILDSSLPDAFDESSSYQYDPASDDPAFVNSVLASPFDPALPATYTRPLGDRLKEHRSAFDWIDPAKHAGIRAGTLSGDLDTEIQAILNSGERRIFWPQGTYPVAIDGFSPTSTIDGIDFYGEGTGRTIINNVSLTTAARPLFISSGADATLRAMEFRANATNMLQPTMGAGQVAFGTAVLLMGADARADNLRVSNAWDNGIGVGAFNLTTGVQSDGQPPGATISNCRTYRCGDGAQTLTAGAPSPQPYNAGSGVNILSGAYANVIACFDLESSQGFILDYAGGGHANFIGCGSYGARKSRVGTYASLDVTPGGQGFYIGARGHIRDCFVVDCEGDGIWMDGYSHDCDISLHVKGAKQRSALIQGRNNKVHIKSEDASQRGSGLYDAVTLRGASATAIDVFTNSTGMNISVETSGTLHRYGLGVEHTPYEVYGSLAPGAILQGATAPVSNARPDFFLIHEYTSGAGGKAIAAGSRTLLSENVSYLVEAFGDNSGNGTFTLASFLSQLQRLTMGVDPINDVSVIQSILAGTGTLPLLLNPSGGSVMVGTGAWNTGPMRLGSHYLWVDSTGDLRIKSSAPSSDTDGTVVGSQS